MLTLIIVVDNIDEFQMNSDIPSINIKYRCNFHAPTTNVVNVRKEFTVLELSYAVIFQYLPPTVRYLNHM
jgi:hypothetical protein